MREFNSSATLLWQQAYLFDRYGNRTIDQANTSTSVNNTQFDSGEFALSNRLYAPGDTSLPMSQRQMQYDAAGNLSYDAYTGQGTRTYDAENRMTSATDSSNHTSTYSYDGDGHRVKRSITVAGQPSPVETWQVYGLGGELIAEYAANGNPATPQKEYGYRNGQLLITTDVGTASAPAPSGLAATPPTSGASITLNWSAASGATNYRIERKGAGGSYILAGNTANTSFTDPVTGGSVYLYKVCAADGAGNCISGYSNIALGAAVTFPTDPTITSIVDDPTGITVTTMKAAHITELRTAVNAVRALAGLSAGTWTNLNIAPLVTTISVADVRDLRTNLGDALSALGIQTPTYTDSTLKGFTEDPLNATPIRAAHIRELRLYTTRGIGGSGGSGTSFAIRWLVSDQLGTPRMIFDQTGLLANVSRHDYLPFGEDLTAGTGGRTTAQGYSASDGVRQHFTRKERDNETGLDYFLARYYSSTQGRYTSPDQPFADQSENDPQSWNLYTYVGNGPLSSTDPSGLWKKVECSTGQCWEAEEGDSWASFAKAVGIPEYGLKKFFVGETISVGQVFDVSGYQSWARSLPPGQSVVYGTYVIPMLPMGGGLRNVAEEGPAAAGLLSRIGSAISALFRRGGGQAAESSTAQSAIKIGGQALKHVLERHAANGARTAGKSIFNASEDIMGLIKQAENVPAVPQAGRQTFERVIDAGRTIGVDRATGQPTSVYTVITDASGNLKTAFPGKP